ncbi:hypothetical protein [Gayadomonas joobiniege]|uniref:hypothetical protein n=1 Tax=Gayadomonas joobiniege TaxID=1234606 RepID=UPI00036A608F|nr:hypothetical protein [Gayadomonas joobiniege]
MIKTRYLLAALALLFTVLTVLSFYFYWQENGALLSKQSQHASAAGTAFGKGKNYSACLNQVIEKSTECRDTNCTIELKHFLVACTEQAEYDAAACEKAPASQDYLGKVSWSVSKCRKAKVKNGNCTNVINEMPLLCEKAQFVPPVD